MADGDHRIHEPTQGQRQAGNYEKRKIPWRGMRIAIENETGSIRRGTNGAGVEWEQRITTPYGYLLGTEGVDGDHVDCFMGPSPDAPYVYVIRARKYGDWDEYDEDKCMIGFESADAARQAFLDNYSDPRFLGEVVRMPAERFVAKVRKQQGEMVKAQQLSLFDEPVRVVGTVKRDGTVVRPYVRIQKVRPENPGPIPVKTPVKTEVKPEAPPEIPAKPPAPKPQLVRKRTPTIESVPDTTLTPHLNEGRPRETPQITGGHLGQFGAAGESKAERRRINAAVVDLLASGKTEYSAEEKALLARYSGNGGCGDSLNEYFTDPAVAKAIWTVLGHLGSYSAVLEPSCGTGVFLHTAPAGIHVTGVELDPVSASAAGILHDRHDVQTSSLERFATSDDRQFDAVIGNAPFGIRGGTIKDDKPDVSRADTYFLDTALDKTRAGGIVAMIVHHGVLDSSRDRAMRERLLTKGRFLGAIRMPNTAFEHSHTEVTSDIVFFQKRPQDVANALGVLSQDQLRVLGVWDEDYLSGGYFAERGKANIFGAVEPGWRAKAGMGNDITVEGSMDEVPAHIAEWQPDASETDEPTMEDILRLAGENDAMRARILGAAIRVPYELTKVGSVKTVAGIQYVLEGEPPRWHRMDEVLARTAVADAQDIAADIDRLIRTGHGDRAEIATQVKSYIEKHGNPAENKDLGTAALQDRLLYRLIGAVHADGSLSDILTRKARAGAAMPFEAAAQALALEQGRFTPAELADRTGKELGEIEDLLHASSDYAVTPAGDWTTMAQYLTGELWPKFDDMQTSLTRTDIDPAIRRKYEAQVKLLNEAIDPKSLEDVDVAVNHAFIPTDIVAAYFNDKKNSNPNDYIRRGNDMAISFGEGVYNVTDGYPYRDLLERYLNRSGVEKDEWDDIQKMNADFKTWLASSPYRDQVESLYNRAFRGYVPAAFSNEPIRLDGLNGEGIKDFNFAGARWAYAHGKGIIAADVGLGKTVRALLLARMLREAGTRRNMIVVPKSVIGKWAAECERWFPGSRVLTIGETVSGEKSRADTAAERNHKLHEYMQNDYDFVLISQPAFNDLDLDPELKKRYTDDDFWVQRADKLGNAGDKRVRAIREAYEQHIAGRDFQKRTDAVYFNDLGVDALIADEGHAYKNLFAVRNRFGESPKFLGGGGLSNRALDMQLKSRWVRDSHGGKGVFMMTATPTKNSPLEIYSMLSHVAPEEFDRIGIRNSEEFLDRFCEFSRGPCLQTDGSIKDALYVSGFKNMDELRMIMSRHIDRQTAEDVGLQLPKRDERMHMIDMSPEQQTVYADLRATALKAAGGDSSGDSHIFSIMDKMGKAALDLELLGYAGARSPKYEEVAKEVAANVKDGGQIIFCEAIAAHDKIKAALAAAGIPEKEIVIFNAQTAKTGDARLKIQNDFNAGKTKVVIGNKTMEEGVDLQKKTADIHHLDIAWEPGTMQQRNGRGVRQGNTNEAVRIHAYLSKGSFDVYRYQAVSAKKSWQDLLWKGGNKIENLERPTLTRDEIMVMMAADPDAARAQMETNKAEAMARYEGAKTAEAAEDFMRYQTMKHNFGALKNKESVAAQRLRVRLEVAKSRLEGDPFFKAKSALNAADLVLLHPTGTVLAPGVGIDRRGEKWVVTHANPVSQHVGLRSYGHVGQEAMRVTLPLADLGDIKPFDYVESNEAVEIGKRFAGAPDEAVNMESVRNLPASVITAQYQPIQERLKSGLAKYQWHVDSGQRLPYLQGGEAKTAESYQAKDIGNAPDTELMLPLPEHRERAVAEYIRAERERELHHEAPYHSRSGRNQPAARLIAKYKTSGYAGADRNPWAEAGASLWGGAFPRAAHAEFEKQQEPMIRDAPTFAEAMRHAAPMIHVDYSGPKWTKNSLAILFAKAKREGILDKPMATVVPKKQVYGASIDEINGAVWRVKNQKMQGHTDVRGHPVGEALIHMAVSHGYNDLAAAMITTSREPRQAAEQLVRLPLDDASVIASIEHLVRKHPEMAALHVGELMHSHELHVAVGAGHDNATLGELADLLRLHAAAPKSEVA